MDFEPDSTSPIELDGGNSLRTLAVPQELPAHASNQTSLHDCGPFSDSFAASLLRQTLVGHDELGEGPFLGATSMKPVDEDRPQPTAERPDPMVVLDGGQPDRDDTKNFPNEVVRVVTWNPTATKPKPKPKPKAGPRPKKAAAQQNQSTHGSPQEFSDGLLVPCPD